ncbi:MAG: HAD family phosphatase [Candidatus Nealsonbacteria bacterium]|nr:HAD family phosphatase [Candidatus Nealsonbacteria bacterium]
MQAAIFDMDGLMLNTEEVYTLVGTELLARRGYEFSDELKNAIMGLRPQPTFETMIRWHALDESWQQMAADSNQIFLALLDEHLAPLPGLFDLLDALERAEVPKAIATSSDRRLVEACLSPFDLQGRFQFVLTAADVTHGKPEPEIYLTAASRLGLPPQETVVLEDSQNGCLAASAAGAYTVAVPGEHSRDQDFSCASLVVESLADKRLYEALDLACVRPGGPLE